ncbi:hypothetical protein SAMN04488490_2848 [Marinobacter sp. LV10R510-11A]|uniref:hypothetical protein n=1 Tax=Marinobacter sp. LV10R510-11A TaxID=1415568 RepID=UPI000BB7A51B|nr:hypothetical protein [Marinobacter sp. LV10R510-11A]SOB77086.1 hypothetical protein SAMN04488490_2848 [Marinobacter sp. LV10R510-11A]
MLSRTEKEDLLAVIDILFDDNQLRRLKSNFNEDTAYIVEQAIEELIKCNASMKELVTGLVAGASILTGGWLRQSLDKIAQALRDKQLQFDGMACRNQGSSQFPATNLPFHLLVAAGYFVFGIMRSSLATGAGRDGPHLAIRF